MVEPVNLCTCVRLEVTHSFKLRPTRRHYKFGDATKSIVCHQLLVSIYCTMLNQERGQTRGKEVLTVLFYFSESNR